jgi:tripartite-type tricarboxylate transporter receptor subunit TctC
MKIGKKFLLMSLILMVVAGAVFAGGGSEPVASAPDGLPKTSSGFPDRAINIIVPYSAASGNDLNVRTIAPSLEKYLGVPVVVTNEPAGNGLPALTKLAKNIKADGYTWSYANIVALTSQSVLGDFEVDPGTEYDYIGVITVDPGIIVAAKDGPYKTLDDIVTASRRNPSSVSYGGTGEYSLDGLLCTNLESLAGIDLNFVNYGGAQGITGIMGGHLDTMGDSLSGSIQAYIDGSINIIGIGGDERAPEIPNVPTFKEQGYSFTIQAAERPLFVPAGTDKETLEFLRNVIKKATEDPEYIERCKQVGMRNQHIDGDTTLKDVKGLMDFFKAMN